MSDNSIVPKVNKLLTAVVIISLIGLFLTAYLTYMHYVAEARSFCTVDETFNCDIVNSSEWASVDLGFVVIPTALLGFGTYLLFLVLSFGVIKDWKFQKIHKVLRRGNIITLMRWICIIGFLISLYLTYVEAFVLKAYCFLCLTHQVLILAILVIFIVIKGMVDKQKNEGKICEFC